MTERPGPSLSCGRRALLPALAVAAGLLAAAPEAGRLRAVAAGEVVARDDAPAAGLNFRGKQLGRTQGESPVFDQDVAPATSISSCRPTARCRGC
jgi:hypothetical protein